MTILCPCCQQPVAHHMPAKALADAKLSSSERRLVGAMSKAFPRSVTMSDLVNALYSNNPSGGPDNAENVVRTMLTSVRKKLPAYGWEIPRSKGGAENVGFYRLQPIQRSEAA